jgi:hypothetical protein
VNLLLFVIKVCLFVCSFICFFIYLFNYLIIYLLFIICLFMYLVLAKQNLKQSERKPFEQQRTKLAIKLIELERVHEQSRKR